MFDRPTRRMLPILATAAALALGGPARADNLRIAFGADPATLDPTATGVMSGFNIARSMFETLIVREFVDGVFQEVPALAESWEFVDETTLEFRLRQGVTFHDGTPFTAEAVAYTFNTINDPGYRTILRAYTDNIDRIEIVSDHVIRFHLKRPSLIVMAQLARIFIVPASHAEGRLAEHPVGTGPYRFVSYTPGNIGVVERNPDYWGTPGRSSTITFRIMPEASTRLAALEAGEVDIVESVPADKLAVYEDSPDIDVVTGLSTRVMSLILNYRQPIMAQPAFREALSSAIDRDAIVEALLNGQTEVSGSISSPASMGYVADLPPYAYDPGAVPGLLAAAGYAGEVISMGCPGGRYAMDRQVCEAIGAMLGEAGIAINLEIVDWPTFITKLYDSSWDLSFTGAPDQLSYPSVSWRFLYYPPTSPTGFANEQITAIVDELDATTDPERARALSAEGQRIFREGFEAAIPLYIEPLIFGVRSNVRDFEIRPDETIEVYRIAVE